jgi:hypothetical protein
MEKKYYRPNSTIGITKKQAAKWASKKSVSKPKAISKNLKKKLKEYTAIRLEYLKNRPACEAKILPMCTYEATDIHHKKGRGKYLCDTNYFLAVCRDCHNWIELHPVAAKKLGFSVSRLI